MQSQPLRPAAPPAVSPFHVAIAMDGNGRWAESRGMPRPEGHQAGVRAARRIVRAAPDLGITTLTLYGFSSRNWTRPRREVVQILAAIRFFLRTELPTCLREGIRVSVIGRRDRLPKGLLLAARRAETVTAAGRRLHLRVAVDYSGRESILRAALRSVHRPRGAPLDEATFGRLVARDSADAGDVDLVIRTGGERRLSDFLLWEAAYAELLFTSTLWPDFGVEDLRAAVTDFEQRERRFGGLGPHRGAVAG